MPLTHCRYTLLHTLTLRTQSRVEVKHIFRYLKKTNDLTVIVDADWGGATGYCVRFMVLLLLK